MSKIDFGEWLQNEINKRNWSQADLSRATGLTTSAISRLLTGERGPGPEAARAIAHALNLPEIYVFQVAGLITEKQIEEEEWPPSLAELIHHFLTSDEKQQEEMLEIIRLLSKRKNEETRHSET